MLINVRTAQPALRYLLAEAGFEPPLVPVREGWEVFNPTGVDVRTVGLNFLFDPADSRLPEDEFWAEDCGGLDLFFRKIENSTTFTFALETTPTLGDVLEQEE